jgi:hypothetical protein
LSKNGELLALLPIPFANLVGFFSQEYQDSRMLIWRSDEANSRFQLTSDFSLKEALSPTHSSFDNVDVQTPFDGSETTGNLEVIEARPNSLKIAAMTNVPNYGGVFQVLFLFAICSYSVAYGVFGCYFIH